MQKEKGIMIHPVLKENALIFKCSTLAVLFLKNSCEPCRRIKKNLQNIC